MMPPLLPAILRPRWTIKYALSSLVVFYFTVCILFDMPFFSSALPSYTGDYEVGTIDIEVPCDGRKISDAILKESSKPAFVLDSVLFSIYYPSVKGAPSQRPLHLWAPQPISLRAEGYARFAHISNFVTNSVFAFGIWALVGSTTIPAKVDVPLHGTVRTYSDYDNEQPMDDYGLPTFPVIILSHGMASSRTDYTQYCGELASRGYIVAAVEHRDGSCPGTIITNNGTTRILSHFDAEQMDPQPKMEDFKVMQLAMRQAEVEETVRVLRELNKGKGKALFDTNPRNEGTDLAEWRGRINFDRMVIAGHSYGATLALQTLKQGPSNVRPFAGAVVLDPGKSSGPLNDDISVPLLVVHSDSWSKTPSTFYGRPHFDVVKDLVRKVMNEKHKYAWFMTSTGTSHPSVTDAPLIEPLLLSWTTGATINVLEGVHQYVRVTQEFMQYLDNGHRKGVLKEEVTHPEYDHDIRGDRRRQEMDHDVGKYWQIHVAPSTFCPMPGLCGLDSD